MPVTINGTTGIAGVDGSAGTPAVQGADTNTGMFFPAADTIAFAEGGTEVLRLNSSAQAEFQAGTSSLPSVTASGDLNTGMFFPAADTIAFTNGGTEEFRFGPAGQLGIAGANYGTSGQVLTSGGASASPSWAAANGFTLLGDLSTTSGSSVSISSLDLTGYKYLFVTFNSVSHNDTTGSRFYLIGNSTADDVQVTPTQGNTTLYSGHIIISLVSGSWNGCMVGHTAANSYNTGTSVGGDLPVTTASTAISVAPSSGSFDNGSILIYGVR